MLSKHLSNKGVHSNGWPFHTQPDNGGVYALISGMWWARYCTSPRKHLTSLNVLGCLHSWMCCMLSASTCIPQSSIIWLRHSNLFEYRSTLLLLRQRWWSLSHWNTIPRFFSCSSIECEYIKISSRYTWMNRLMQSWKIAVISHWNIEGALQSPICITWLLNVLSTVANAILWMCSGMMRICSYGLDILSFERYAALAISLRMISWSGNGVNPWLCWRSVLVNWKQYVVYHCSLVCRALAPLYVPLC